MTSQSSLKAGRPARRIAAVAAAALAVGALALATAGSAGAKGGDGGVSTAATIATISSAGPLNNILIGSQLNCQVNHVGGASFEFYDPGDSTGDCGTLIAIGDTLYGPSVLNAGGNANPRTPYEPRCRSRPSRVDPRARP